MSSYKISKYVLSRKLLIGIYIIVMYLISHIGFTFINGHAQWYKLIKLLSKKPKVVSKVPQNEGNNQERNMRKKIKMM